MTLNTIELDKMRYLLGKAESRGHNSLSVTEQQELRRYIRKESPSAQDESLDALIALGFIIIGAYLIYKILE